MSLFLYNFCQFGDSSNKNEESFEVLKNKENAGKENDTLKPIRNGLNLDMWEKLEKKRKNISKKPLQNGEES